MIMDLAIFKNISKKINGIDITKKYKYEQLFARVPGEISVYIIDSGYNYRLIISSKSRRNAYSVLYLIKGFYTLIVPNLSYSGTLQNNQLMEFYKRPKASWRNDDWLSNLNKSVHQNYFNFDDLKIELTTATGIFDHDEAKYLKNLIEREYGNQRLAEAMNHARESIQLFNGIMNSSYYYSHYIRDRKNLTRQAIEKAYYEKKETYELAFLAAFKAIERLLNVNDIKRREIKTVLNNSGLVFTNAEKKYERAFEKFIGFKRIINQSELVEHFLNLRNTVGAHANKNPPQSKVIAFDSIYEIQYFLSIWINEYLEERVHA